MRLPLLTQLDMPQGMCPYIKEHSLGLPRRLRRLRGGPSLRLRHPGDAINLRLLLLRSKALSSRLFFEAFYAPEEVGRSPEGVFGGRSLSPICGPVGFRGVAPHHKPIHPEHLHCIPAISHGSLHHERSLLSVQGAVLRVDNCPSCLYTADGSNIRHSPLLRCQDAQIPRRLVESSRIQARDRLLQVCEELGLQVNFRKSSLIPSQDMTYLGMQIQSVRFIAKPTATRVENLLKIIEEFLSSPGPPAALWRRLPGHLSSLTLLVKGGMLRMRSLQVRLRSRWDFRDEFLRIPWDPLCQEDLLCQT